MQLTTEQKTALAADIAANPQLVAYRNAGNVGALATYYSTTASPDFIVWRTFVTQDEIMQNGFDWMRVDNLSVGKARIWDWLFSNADRAINPTKDNVRAGIAECWKGTAADLAVQAVVLGHCKRKANRMEKLFATGTGTDASPATMTFEGDAPFYYFEGL